jgi:hypothetical protein
MRKSLASMIVSGPSCLTFACVVAATMALTTPAKADVVFEPPPGTDPGALPGVTTFDSAPFSVGNLTQGTGYTQIGNNLTFTNTTSSGLAQILNTTSSNGAEPFGDTSNYLSVLGGGSVTVSVNKGFVNTVSFLWGSVDTYNSIKFYDGSTLIGSFTGSDLLPSLQPTGCQDSANCTGYVTFADTDPTQTITSFVMASTYNSFETDDFLASQVGTPPVPEASTWVMMILGFFGVGLVSYRRRGVSFRMV